MVNLIINVYFFAGSNRDADKLTYELFQILKTIYLQLTCIVFPAIDISLL